MGKCEKGSATRLSVTLSLLVLGIVGAFWWARIPPMRPANVPPNAVFVWGLPVGLPAPKRGDWVNCWFDADQAIDKCRVTHIDGSLKYVGAFVPYRSNVPLNGTELAIDSRKTNLALEQVQVDATSQEASEAGPTSVPLIYLLNGDVLIPEKSYAEGKHRLNELQKADSPYAPKKGPER